MLVRATFTASHAVKMTLTKLQNSSYGLVTMVKVDVVFLTS
jgi:hypothetical protein